jgi:CHASE2 domain-containing sensor protein
MSSDRHELAVTVGAGESLLSKFVRLDPRLAKTLVLAFAFALVMLVYNGFGPNLYLLEERLGALGWTLAPDDDLEERITIVAIDERSIAEVGPWPWARETLAELVESIDAAGAQLQLHDIAYSDPKEGDDVLVSALRAARGAVIAQIPVLAENSSDPALVQNINVGEMTHSVGGVSCNEIPGKFPTSENYVAAADIFSGVAKGHITPLVNGDGSISKQPAVICINDLPYPAFAVAAFLQAASVDGGFQGVDQVDIEPLGGLFAPAQRLTLGSYPGLAIPLDVNGGLRVSYASSPAVYQAISAADILNGSADLSVLQNAWVLVGATAFGLGDVVPTPYSGATPGVELQARIIASILDIEVPYTPRSGFVFLLFLCLAFAFALFRLAGVGGRAVSLVIPALILALPLLALGLHAALLNNFSVWLGWVLPALYGGVSASLIFLFEQARIRVQRNLVLANLKSYLPSDAAQQIAFSLPSSNISAERRDVTLLSADLRNFSAYSEARPATESAAVLHFFFQRATKIIEKNNGRIHEFTGDGLLAIWDSSDTESGESAYRAGLTMLEQINDQLLETFALDALEPLAVGIGIEQGPALIGSIGPAHRRAHALLGDTVTIVLRIQELTADLAQPILLGECVARQIGNIQMQSQGSYLLAGLTNPHVLFAPAPVRSHARTEKLSPKLKVLPGGKAR